MDLKLLEILRCPGCKNQFTCNAKETNAKNQILTGELICQSCKKTFPIIRSVPRFVPMENYAASFGYQWNLYKYTQVDRYSEILNSEERFFAETGWSKEEIQSNWVLDVGCGNGRFLEVCSRFDCQVVGVDISSAIDAAAELFKDHDNVHLIQASIYDLPFAKNVFDKCYCIGVIQHTPDVNKSVCALPEFIKENGKFALTIYERKPWTLFYAKYLWRPITKRLNKQLLLAMIKFFSLILFPLTEILFRIPVLKKIFKFIIPYANYVDMPLSFKQRYEWSVLDTFDMLSPAYDSPMTEIEVYTCLSQCQMKNIERLPNPGVNMVAIK